MRCMVIFAAVLAVGAAANFDIFSLYGVKPAATRNTVNIYRPTFKPTPAPYFKSTTVKLAPPVFNFSPKKVYSVVVETDKIKPVAAVPVEPENLTFKAASDETLSVSTEYPNDNSYSSQESSSESSYSTPQELLLKTPAESLPEQQNTLIDETQNNEETKQNPTVEQPQELSPEQESDIEKQPDTPSEEPQKSGDSQDETPSFTSNSVSPGYVILSYSQPTEIGSPQFDNESQQENLALTENSAAPQDSSQGNQQQILFFLPSNTASPAEGLSYISATNEPTSLPENTVSSPTPSLPTFYIQPPAVAVNPSKFQGATSKQFSSSQTKNLVNPQKSSSLTETSSANLAFSKPVIPPFTPTPIPPFKPVVLSPKPTPTKTSVPQLPKLTPIQQKFSSLPKPSKLPVSPPTEYQNLTPTLPSFTTPSTPKYNAPTLSSLTYQNKPSPTKISPFDLYLKKPASKTTFETGKSKPLFSNKPTFETLSTSSSPSTFSFTSTQPPKPSLSEVITPPDQSGSYLTETKFSEPEKTTDTSSNEESSSLNNSENSSTPIVLPVLGEQAESSKPSELTQNDYISPASELIAQQPISPEPLSEYTSKPNNLPKTETRFYEITAALPNDTSASDPDKKTVTIDDAQAYLLKVLGPWTKVGEPIPVSDAHRLPGSSFKVTADKNAKVKFVSIVKLLSVDKKKK